MADWLIASASWLVVWWAVLWHNLLQLQYRPIQFFYGRWACQNSGKNEFLQCNGIFCRLLRENDDGAGFDARRSELLLKLYLILLQFFTIYFVVSAIGIEFRPSKITVESTQNSSFVLRVRYVFVVARFCVLLHRLIHWCAGWYTRSDKSNNQWMKSTWKIMMVALSLRMVFSSDRLISRLVKCCMSAVLVISVLTVRLVWFEDYFCLVTFHLVFDDTARQSINPPMKLLDDFIRPHNPTMNIPPLCCFVHLINHTSGISSGSVRANPASCCGGQHGPV